MERPQARIIDQQQVEGEREITGWEAEQLLRKYGHQPESFSTHQNTEPQNVDNGLTFEEMLAQEEMKRREEEQRRIAKQFGPKPTTFDGSRGYDAEVKYGSDDESGFSYRIEITTDMNIPKY